MAIVITESDCDFLKNTYNPTGKVEIRVKSILVKLGLGYREISQEILKDIYIDGEALPKEDNKIVLGELAKPEFKADDGKLIPSEDYEEGKKYVPILGADGKIPARMMSSSVINDVYVFDETGWSWNEICEKFLKETVSVEGNRPERGDILIITKDPKKVGTYILKADADDLPGYWDPEKDAYPINGFAKLQSPLGHVSELVVNGEHFYGFESDGVIDLRNVVRTILSNKADVLGVSIDEAGTATINVATAGEDQEGVVKLTDTLEKALEEDYHGATDVKLVKEIYDEINSKINELTRFYKTSVQLLSDDHTVTIEHNLDDLYCDIIVFEQILDKYEEVYVTKRRINRDTVELGFIIPENKTFEVTFKRRGV